MGHPFGNFLGIYGIIWGFLRLYGSWIWRLGILQIFGLWGGNRVNLGFYRLGNRAYYWRFKVLRFKEFCNLGIFIQVHADWGGLGSQGIESGTRVGSS